jgi:hypothetical protein
MLRKSLTAVSALVAASVAQGAYGADLTRLGAVSFKSEVTGITVNAAGDLFFNSQHPEGAAAKVGDGPAAIIGYAAGVDMNAYDGGSIAIPAEDMRNQN